MLAQRRKPTSDVAAFLKNGVDASLMNSESPRDVAVPRLGKAASRLRRHHRLFRHYETQFCSAHQLVWTASWDGSREPSYRC
jgi:hypothetical protein